MKEINEKNLSVIKTYCVENPEIDDIPKLRMEFAKDFRKKFPIEFKIRTSGYFQVHDNGMEKNLKTTLWSRNFEDGFGDRMIYSLEFEEGIKVRKCDKVTYDFCNLNAREFECEWRFL